MAIDQKDRSVTTNQAEPVETVAYVTTGFSSGSRTRRAFTMNKADADQQHENWLPHYRRVTTDELMTVAQHERIVAAITAGQARIDARCSTQDLE